MKTALLKPVSLTLLILAILVVPTAWAKDIESHPGYADLGTFERTLGSDTEFDLDLDQQSLAALASVVQTEGDQLNDLVESVQSVRARAFKLDKSEVSWAREGLADVSNELKGGGWNTLVSVNDDSDQVEILFKSRNEHIIGIAALFVGQNEAGFANVVGEIDLAKVLALAPSLGSFQDFLKQMKNRGEQDG